MFTVYLDNNRWACYIYNLQWSRTRVASSPFVAPNMCIMRRKSVHLYVKFSISLGRFRYDVCAKSCYTYLMFVYISLCDKMMKLLTF